MPVITQARIIPAQAINVDIEITDQTADVDATGRSAPVKVTVRASAIVSVGEDEAMVNTAANKFFSKSGGEQLSTLTDVLSSAGRRAINLLKHDQLFNMRSFAAPPSTTALAAARSSDLAVAPARGDDDELAVIIKDACSRELMDLGLSFNSLNIKAVLSEVADARRRESAARAKADADVVQAQEEQRARIAQLEAQQKINDQERALNMQIASNGAAIARAEAEKQAAVRQQREAELGATQITQARADAEQNVIQQEAEGRAQAARIRAIAEAEAEAIRMKAAGADGGRRRLPRSAAARDGAGAHPPGGRGALERPVRQLRRRRLRRRPRRRDHGVRRRAARGADADGREGHHGKRLGQRRRGRGGSRASSAARSVPAVAVGAAARYVTGGPASTSAVASVPGLRDPLPRARRLTSGREPCPWLSCAGRRRSSRVERRSHPG